MPSTTSLPSPVQRFPELGHAAGWEGILAWLGTGVGFGLVSGWVVGFALKKMALFAAFILGIVFIVIQVLVVNRLVTVDWVALAGFFGQAARSVSAPDASWWKILVSNFPFAGSFGVGFVLGVRKG